MSLNVKAPEFKPPSLNVKAPEFKPLEFKPQIEVEYDEDVINEDTPVYQASYVINVDDYIVSILQNIPYGYYVKGGKAFNHYFPNQQVETDDWDLIATNDVYKLIYYQMKNLLGHTALLFGYKPKMVNRISERVVSYEDDMNGEKIAQTVKTIEINGTGVMDVIIVAEITDAVTVENGVIYQERGHFIMDVQQTYRNRSEKSRSMNKKRGKQMSKLDRSRRRNQIASASGKRKRKSTKKLRKK